MVYSRRVPYRDAGRVGSARHIWELNRHHHLLQLARAYATSGDPRYANEVARQLLLWVQANPFLTGINWNQGLECGIRMMVWPWLERLIRGSEGHAAAFGPASPMWKSVYHHQLFLARVRSHGSSANNHLIGETAGLAASTIAWPFFKESQRWRAKAITTLTAAYRTQTHPSGLNREQAFGYHLFTLEIGLALAWEASIAEVELPAELSQALSRMANCVAQLLTDSGNSPRYGDSDDGHVLWHSPTEPVYVRFLLDLAANLLGPQAAPGPAEWVAQSHGEKPGTVGPPSRHRTVRHWADAGLIQVRDSGHTILVKGGPLGYGSLAAHGHADALSFTLEVDGTEVLVDPGTYCYHLDPEQRNYFRGTRGHNTLTLDGQDQARSGGLFLWDSRPSTTLDYSICADGTVEVYGSHDGYTHLDGAPVHARQLVAADSSLTVIDTLTGEGPHDIEVAFHWAPWTSVRLQAGQCSFSTETVTGALQLDPRMRWQLFRGDADHGGWYSESFGRRDPAVLLLGRCRAQLPASFQCHLVWTAHKDVA